MKSAAPRAYRSSFILLPSSLRLLLAPLGAVLGSTAFPPLDAQGVERAADDVVAHAGQVAHPAASDEHDAVLLEVVLLAGDVRSDFLAVAQPHAGDLAQGRVGLLGGHGLDLEADAPLLRGGLEVLDLVDPRQCPPRLLDQLVNRRHRLSFLTFTFYARLTRPFAQGARSPGRNRTRLGFGSPVRASGNPPPAGGRRGSIWKATAVSKGDKVWGVTRKPIRQRAAARRSSSLDGIRGLSSAAHFAVAPLRCATPAA